MKQRHAAELSKDKITFYDKVDLATVVTLPYDKAVSRLQSYPALVSALEEVVEFYGDATRPIAKAREALKLAKGE